MKLLIAPLALFLLVPPGREPVALAFAPEAGTVLARRFEARAEYHLADIQAEVDGEVIPREGELPEDESSFVERIVVTDTLGPVVDGRPAEVVRSFDALSQENGGSDGEEGSTLTSPLEGRRVRFTWDDEDGSYRVAADDDEELDEGLAAWLAEDMDLRLVLPEDEVEPGDEWELDARLYLAFMWPSGLLDFRLSEEEAPEDEERSFSRQTIERLDGAGTARLEELRDEDGARVAVIHVELEITTGSEQVLPEVEVNGRTRPEISIEIEIERSLEGTILWDLEHGHALSAELECSSSRLETRQWTLVSEEDGEEHAFEVEESVLHEGTIEYSASIERE
jgi:hypothetical protein